MRNGIFTPEEKEKLLANKYVVNIVQDSQVIYAHEFKQIFVEKYMAGEMPQQIFKDAGFDVKILGTKRIERCGYRWRNAFKDGKVEATDAGSVRHEANQRKRDSRITTLKKENKEKVDELTAHLDVANAKIKYLKDKLNTACTSKANNTRLRIPYYIKEGVDVSEEICYMGQKIREIRKMNGVTAAKLSLILRCSHDTLRRIELGEKAVPIDYLLKIMKLFDCPIDTFFRNDSLETDDLD